MTVTSWGADEDAFPVEDFAAKEEADMKALGIVALGNDAWQCLYCHLQIQGLINCKVPNQSPAATSPLINLVALCPSFLQAPLM